MWSRGWFGGISRLAGLQRGLIDFWGILVELWELVGLRVLVWVHRGGCPSGGWWVRGLKIREEGRKSCRGGGRKSASPGLG